MRSERNRLEMDGVVRPFAGKERGNLKVSTERLPAFARLGYVVALLGLELQA